MSWRGTEISSPPKLFEKENIDHPPPSPKKTKTKTCDQIGNWFEKINLYISKEDTRAPSKECIFKKRQIILIITKK